MAANATALLIGSWEYDRLRATRDGEGKGQSRIDHKRGKRRVFTKEGDVRPGWTFVVGDLARMESFIGSRDDIDLFDVLDYRERKDSGYARGKKDVLLKLEAFFGQDDQTHFILYFTGHGSQDGSWCFTVTKADRSRSRSGTATAASGGATATVTNEAPTKGGGASPGASNAVPGGATNAVPLPRAEDEDTPDPDKKWNELLTFEKIVQTWDDSKRGRERHLMMILDCCHSGRWVQKINEAVQPEQPEQAEPTEEAAHEGGEGEDGIGNEGVEGGEPRQTAHNKGAEIQEVEAARLCAKRRDICIQAACHPSELSMIAKSQLCSTFTESFIDAQRRTPFEKLVLTAIDHLFVLNIVSLACYPQRNSFTPMSSSTPPFAGIRFFDSFDEMHLKTH